MSRMRALGTILWLIVSLPAVAVGQEPESTGEGSNEVLPVDIDEVVATTICNSEFGGEFASLVLWTLDGELTAIELRGDIIRFSHPPSLYFDAQGNELGVIPLEPVVPGSPEAIAFEEEIAGYTGGGSLSETRSCSIWWEGSELGDAEEGDPEE